MRFFLLQNKRVRNQVSGSAFHLENFSRFQTFKVSKTLKVSIKAHLFLTLTGFQNPLVFFTVAQAFSNKMKDHFNLQTFTLRIISLFRPLHLL